jgi:hypothetical protein
MTLPPLVIERISGKLHCRKIDPNEVISTDKAEFQTSLPLGENGPHVEVIFLIPKDEVEDLLYWKKELYILVFDCLKY